MKKPALLAATISTMLISCQTIIPASKQDSQSAYKAHGTEPFWSLSLADGAMTFSKPDGVDLRVKEFDARPSINGWRYVSADITADVTFAECSDGMSELTYKDQVRVQTGGVEYLGCGGGIVAPKSLEGTTWRIKAINGVAVAADPATDINFADGRMSGSAGCNRLGSEYKFVNRTLSFGPVMSTKMACPDPVGKQEFAFVQILGALVSTTFAEDGSMVLTDKAGGTAVLERSI
jgi:heat shock protein HslJ